MTIQKKAVALTALAFALLLPAAPAFAEDDDYVGGNPPCIPEDEGGMPSGDDECESPNEDEKCVPGNPDSGSGVDTDGNGTPDECEECVPGNPDSGSGVDTDGDGTPDECDEVAVDTGAPGGVESGGEATTGGAGQAEAPGGTAAESAPSGSLPVTGGDVVGLALIGAAAVATGTVLVRRSRRHEDATAA